jgi:PRTRC genetic system protein E
MNEETSSSTTEDNTKTDTPTVLEKAEKPVLTTESQLGIIQGLAETISVKGSLLLVIAKTKEDTLLVTVQPGPGEKDVAGSALALQITGSPAELDAKLLEALSHYVPARKFVVKTAEEIAAATASAAAHAKAEAEKKRTTAATTKTTPPTKSAPAVRQEKLTINTIPLKATLKVTNTKNEELSVKEGEATNLEIGRYTVVASAEGYESQTVTINLARTETQNIFLKIHQPSLLNKKL